jgi:hypothetical protein
VWYIAEQYDMAWVEELISVAQRKELSLKTRSRFFSKQVKKQGLFKVRFSTLGRGWY